MIADSIVSEIQNLTPPGRFLKKDTKTGLWKEVDSSMAREKTLQALREKSKSSSRSHSDASMSLQQSESSNDLDISEHSARQQHQQEAHYYPPTYAGAPYPVYFQGYVSAYPMGHSQHAQQPPPPPPQAHYLPSAHPSHPHFHQAPEPVAAANNDQSLLGAASQAAAQAAAVAGNADPGWAYPPAPTPTAVPTPLSQPPSFQFNAGLDQYPFSLNERPGGSDSSAANSQGGSSARDEPAERIQLERSAHRAAEGLRALSSSCSPPEDDVGVARAGPVLSRTGTPFSPHGPYDPFARFAFSGESPGSVGSMMYRLSPPDQQAFPPMPGYHNPLSPTPLPPNFHHHQSRSSPTRRSSPSRSPVRQYGQPTPASYGHPYPQPPSPSAAVPPQSNMMYTAAAQSTYPTYQQQHIHHQRIQGTQEPAPPGMLYRPPMHQQQQGPTNPEQKDPQGYYHQQGRQEHSYAQQGLTYSPMARVVPEGREAPSTAAGPSISPPTFDGLVPSPAFLRLMQQHGSSPLENLAPTPGGHPQRYPLPGAHLAPRYQQGSRYDTTGEEGLRRDQNSPRRGS